MNSFWFQVNHPNTQVLLDLCKKQFSGGEPIGEVLESTAVCWVSILFMPSLSLVSMVCVNYYYLHLQARQALAQKINIILKTQPILTSLDLGEHGSAASVTPPSSPSLSLSSNVNKETSPITKLPSNCWGGFDWKYCEAILTTFASETGRDISTLSFRTPEEKELQRTYFNSTTIEDDSDKD